MSLQLSMEFVAQARGLNRRCTTCPYIWLNLDQVIVVADLLLDLNQVQGLFGRLY